MWTWILENNRASMPMIRERGRNNLLWLLMGFVAIVIYGIGLISPLTPSEGVPSLSMILVFVGIPLGLITAAALLSQSKIIKGIMILEALFIIVFTIYLLRLQKAI
jgi:hypothetical protein